MSLSEDNVYIIIKIDGFVINPDCLHGSFIMFITAWGCNDIMTNNLYSLAVGGKAVGLP